MAAKELNEVLKDGQRAQIAVLVLMNESEASIASKLGIHSNTVNRIKHEPEFIALLEDMTKKKVNQLLHKWMNKLETLESHAWSAFLHNLKDKKNLEAVKLFMDMIGFSKKHEGQTQDGKIVIIMPDAKQEKDLGSIPADSIRIVDTDQSSGR